MTYTGIITLDYNHPDSNTQTRLTNALVLAGWQYAETSAVVVDSENLDEIRLGLEVLARAIETPGELSALSIQVQMVGPERGAPAESNHRKALARLLKEELPSVRATRRKLNDSLADLSKTLDDADSLLED